MKIGFLPLYIELYDRAWKSDGVKARIFAQTVAKKLESLNLEVVASPVCRLKDEFYDAVKLFERSGCEAILTVHLAYSPALEAIDALAATDLPIVIMDTTPDAAFTNPGTQVMPNHGIHGVQDLGNLLNRKDKRFLIAAGAFSDALLAQVKKLLASAAMAYKMDHARIGRVGGTFIGMGDFTFDPRDVGFTEVAWREPVAPTKAEIAAEMSADRAKFQIGNLTEEVHRRATVDNLRIRKWVEAEHLDGFTMSFPGITHANGWSTVPFLECSKSMARGIGYAGEGDTLTAALHTALFKAFPEAGFAEMFCPDWQGNKIFTSHMGEINLNLLAEPAYLCDSRYACGDADDPAVAYGCFKPGKAFWVDLAPLADGKFRLITAPVEFLVPAEESRIKQSNAGWFRPANGGNIADFLAAYTRLGGTHHAVVVYNADGGILSDFAHLMKWEYSQINL